MTIRELRNILVRELYKGLGSGPKVYLSDQTQPEAAYPYIYYQPVQPYMQGGHNIKYEQAAADAVRIRRIEQAEATYSFTACSINRTMDGIPVSGDDEAAALADQAQGWFLHAGRRILSLQNIVVVEVTNAQVRSAPGIEDTDRRYGFDVRVRYARDDALIEEAIQQINVKEA